MVSSATATAFLPGQLATYTPRAEAASTAIVLVPAPARMTSARLADAPRWAALTLVLRTTSTSGWTSARAAASASS
jgi:hypothetical protein